MGILGKVLDKWSKKEREQREKERLDAIRDKKLKEAAEMRREEIIRIRKAKKLQFEDMKKSVIKKESELKERKKNDELKKI